MRERLFILTGTSSGIGKAVAQTLLERGDHRPYLYHW